MRSRQAPLIAYVNASSATTAAGDETTSSRPASDGPITAVTDSEMRSVAFAFCTSRATRGVMLATPGWNIALPAPTRASSTRICHRSGVPSRNSSASTVWTHSRAASEMIISRRAPRRSDSTPPKMISAANGAINAASA
nr:hypothetical protein [Jiangella rhizosphaerae]